MDAILRIAESTFQKCFDCSYDNVHPVDTLLCFFGKILICAYFKTVSNNFCVSCT